MSLFVAGNTPFRILCRELAQKIREHSRTVVLALLSGSSLAHGFATAESDVDVMLVIPDDLYQQRVHAGQLTLYQPELATYPNGYVDGKYLSPGFLETIKTKGSEPARFAFQDAQILFSRLDDLSPTLKAIACYPAEQKAERLARFYAQFQAWHWYTSEALKHRNPYLLGLSASKLILFGGRLLLAHNEQLYPYHKWFLRVLADAPDKPAGLMELIEQATTAPGHSTLESFYNAIQNFRQWEVGAVAWPMQFMLDSEWNWLEGETPVDNL